MAITLNPSLDQLGIAAPYIGRWFSSSSSANVTLPAPANRKLGLDISFTNSETKWLPPATGLFGLFIGHASAVPAHLAALRNVQGEFPFAANDVIAYFSLLPEVEARLHALMRHIPPLTEANQNIVENPSGQATRVRVRSFALVFAKDASGTSMNDIGKLWPLIPSPPDNLTDSQKAQYLGLELTDTSAKTLRNGKRPMSQLRRPGTLVPLGGGDLLPEDAILVGLKNMTATLWAFDAGGRPIDPGAVAAWFTYLALNIDDKKLVAPPGDPKDWPSTTSGDKRVCLFDKAHTVHLVNAHQGRLDDGKSPFVQAANPRLQLGGTGVTDTLIVNATASNNASDEMSFAFSPKPTGGSNPPHNPPLDNAPFPRLALLPSADYGSTLKLWLSGQDVSTGLSRDFARVAVVDIERHLVGVARRDSATVPQALADRHEADQNRPSTRVSVELVTTPDSDPAVLLATIENATDRIIKVFSDGTTPARLVVGVADAQAGAITPAAMPTIASTVKLPSTFVEASTTGDPTAAGTFVVRALAGCGALSGTDYVDQQVLLIIKVDAPADPTAQPSGLSGAWVRVWPLGFDFRRAEHFRMDGGGGRVGNDGIVRLVMALPDSKAKTAAPPSFDLMIVRADDKGRIHTRTYGDCRYHRPAPDTGSGPLDPTSLTSTSKWFICEQQNKSGTCPMTSSNTVSPGETVVLATTTTDSDGKETTTFTLGKRSKLPMVTATLGKALAAKDVVALTQPAFKLTPDWVDDRGMLRGQASDSGHQKGGLDTTTDVFVDYAARSILHDTVASHPFITQERLELVASRLDTSDAIAVIGSASLLPRAHEVLPHFAGHPGAPATTEIHGTGVRLQGKSAAWAAEYVLDRTAGVDIPLPDELKTLGLGAFWPRSEVALAWAVAHATPPTFAEPPTGPHRWAAVLRTVSAGVEGLPGVNVAAGAAYPLSAVPDKVFTWLDKLNLPGISQVGSKLGAALKDATPAVVTNIIRAFDRRIKAATEGAREAAFALDAAFARAEDLVYIETPAIDIDEHGPNQDKLNVLLTLIGRLADVKGLHVVVCMPSRLLPDMPRCLEEIRDVETLKAISGLRDVASDRVAIFSPGAGAGRSLRLASTTVIVDDVFALTGTTHLSRRGLTFDSSYAAAVFDEKVTAGRSTEVRNFRRTLLAGRLGIAPSLVPDDPAELVRAVQDFDLTGSFRLAFRPLLVPPTLAEGADPPGANQPPPPSYPTDTDRDIWNPDGSQTDISFATLIALFLRASAAASPADQVNDPTS